MPLLDCVIDVSHWNNVIDFNEVKQSGIVGVILKASQGTAYADPTYHERRQQALDCGLLSGAYHFGEGGNVATQVEHFLSTTDPTATDLLVLDWEPYSQGPIMTRAEAEDFVCRVEAQAGRWPGLYSGQSFLYEQLGSGFTAVASPLRHCFLWIARYSSERPVVPVIWPTFSLWQYTDQGTVPGVDGLVDRNQWNGTLENLYRLWGVLPPEETSLA
jgi:lysozyme